MRIVLQRVDQAQVRVNKEVVGKINAGYVLLVGIGKEDSSESVSEMAEKVLRLRIMPDSNDKMNLSILDTRGEILAVPQFTLYADLSQGRRPYFGGAASSEKARKLFDSFVRKLIDQGTKVETGEFGAHMEVELVNDGPVTILLDI